MVRERESINEKGLCRYRDGVTEDSPHIALFWDVLQVREREGGGGDHGEPRLHARTHMQRQIPLGCGTFAPFYLAHRARAHTQAAPSPTPAPPPSHAHTHTHTHTSARLLTCKSVRPGGGCSCARVRLSNPLCLGIQSYHCILVESIVSAPTFGCRIQGIRVRLPNPLCR